MLNRKKQKISLAVDKIRKQRGLVFVMHGLGGFKEQPHIKTFIKAFNEQGYTAVSFDATNSFGRSDGQYEDATVTNYYDDLEDVINWSRGQDFFQEPFYLIGHSLGSMCITLYAENYPNEIKGIAPISTLVSGKMSLATPKHKKIIKEWQKIGWHITKSSSQPGVIKKLKWSHMEDRLKYDLLKKVDKLTMPILMLVGDQDTSTLPRQQKIFYEKLSGKKEIHIIKNAPHTFIDKKHLKEIKAILIKWIGGLN